MSTAKEAEGFGLVNRVVSLSDGEQRQPFLGEATVLHMKTDKK
jgi:hypothetical protein